MIFGGVKLKEELSKADRKFTNLQNQFRGLVSKFKSTSFDIDRRGIAPPTQFRCGLRNLLLNARADLQVSQFPSFIEWVDLQLKKKIVDIENIPVGYDELLGLYTKAPIVPLERELLWVTSRLRIDAAKISVFRSLAEEVERLLFSDETEAAIATVKQTEEAFGNTLWSVQLRIALEQMAGGLERQKKYTAEVRGVYKRGLLGFIAYHTSVRNEDRSTFKKYSEDIKARINRHQYYDDAIKSYARYRLAGEWPLLESGLADILRIEQSHSLVDLYETFVAVALEITKREDWTNTREILVKCLQHLPEHINDFRLVKLLQVLEGQYNLEKISYRTTSISDPLFLGDLPLATRIARTELKAPLVVDCWQYIYAGIALSHATRPKIGTFKKPSEIPWLIGKVLRRGDSDGDAIAQLEKMVMNLRGVPAAAGFVDLIPVIRRPEPDAPWQPWSISMNSRTIGIEDFPSGKYQTFMWLASQQKHSIGPTEAAWGRLHGHYSGFSSLSDIAVTLFSAAGMLRERQYGPAVEILTPLKTEDQPESIRAMTALMLLHGYFSQGNRQHVIEIIADEGSRGKMYIDLIPIVPSLASYQLIDYDTVQAPLARSIALHLLWTQNEDSGTASHLRYATGVAIRQSGVRFPHMMASLADRYPSHQLVYFLRHVCVPEIIDVSRVLKSTRQVLEERIAICTALQGLDKSNEGIYKDEQMEISNSLAVAEGQWIVDQTRIHVDSEALMRWATREFSEDFSRYRDLAILDIREKQNFDDVLKELAAVTHSSHRATFTPENEADAVLLSILNRCRDEFLCNPNYGFDFHLSKRIRHQSFIGLIRAPLEFSHLITTRESEFGGYNRNDHWINKFTNLITQEKEALNTVFIKFSSKFDEILCNAKDKRFHLRSPERPAGLFFIDLPPQIILLLRTLMEKDTTLIDFLATVISTMWGAIDPSLAEARKYVSVELKTKLCQVIDELRAAVRKIAEKDPTFLELDMVIGQRSTEVQRAVDEVSMWFSHSNLESMKRNFTIDQIFDVATDSALKCRRPFDPVITRKVDSDCEMLNSSSLVLIHDVLFTAFDNARAHSGHTRPNIEISAIIRKSDGTITVEVVSEASRENRAEQEEELREIRQLIDNRNFERRTRNEGKSGIIKLAAVAYQSAKGSVSFRFEDNLFRLNVTHSLIIEETTNKLWSSQ